MPPELRKFWREHDAVNISLSLDQMLLVLYQSFKAPSKLVSELPKNV